MFRRPLQAKALALLLGIVALAAFFRMAHLGADVPVDAEATFAPLLDAFWYMEAGAGPAEGSTPEAIPFYDPPVWTSLTRVWFTVAGASLETAQILGAVIGLLSLLLTWRITRATFGEEAALVAAAILAVLYPYAALSRTTLIYGPLTLALLVAAALWLRARDGSPASRALHEGAAWLLVLAAGATFRPPAWALLGGLALASLVRWPRLRAGALVTALLGGALLAAFLADPGRLGILGPMHRMGGLWAETAWRIQRKLDPTLSLHDVVGGWAAWGSLPTAGGSPGFVALAPFASLAALLGLTLAVARRRTMTTAQKEGALLFGGWWAGLVVFLPFFPAAQRPLRYFMLIAPPLAALGGFALARWVPRGEARFMGPGEAGQDPPHAPRRGALERLMGSDRWLALGAALAGSMIWTHGSILLLKARPERAPQLALEGALLAGLLWAMFALHDEDRRERTPFGALVSTLSRARRHPLPPWGLGLLIVASGLVSCLGLLRTPSDGRAAQREARLLLAKEGEVVLGGPYASFLAFGAGLERRRTPWLVTHPDRILQTIARLRAAGVTHIALDVAQERSAHLEARFAERGQPLTLVGKVQPRVGKIGGIPYEVIVFRLPWAGITPHLVPPQRR